MKKLLFVPIGFYDYDDMIEKELVKAGYDVTSFTPIGDFNKHKIERAINVISKDRYVYRKAHDRSVKYLLSDDTKFDVIFVIVGRHLLPDIMDELHRKNPNATFILYLWDDIKRVKYFKKNRHHYDKIFTFDSADADKYGFEFLPLFYTDSHRYAGEDKRYDLSLIGTYHSDRLGVWEKILSKVHLKDIRLYLYLVPMQIKQVLEAYIPFLGKGDKWKTPKYIRLKLQSFEVMAKKLKESKVTLDVQFGSQNGLTLRTIESLAARTKLITTNQNVEHYDFYDYGNIYVIDRENPEVPQDFLQQPYNEIPDEVVEKYSLSSWVRTILS